MGKKKPLKQSPILKKNLVQEVRLSNDPREVKSPLPSVRNYPEDNNPEWLIGLDGEGDKVKAPPTGTASSITLTGAVTGSGSLENPISTALSTPLNAQSSRIINVSSPVNTTDAANKSYVDSQSGGGGGIQDCLIADFGTNWPPELTVNQVIKWSGIQSSSGTLIKRLNDTTFELEPGHTYELAAWVPVSTDQADPATGVHWMWFIQSSGPAIGLAIGIQGAAQVDSGNWGEHEDFRPALALLSVSDNPVQVYVKINAVDSSQRFRTGEFGYCKIIALN